MLGGGLKGRDPAGHPSLGDLGLVVEAGVGLDGLGEKVRPFGETSYIATTSTATPVADFNIIGVYSLFFSFP